MLLDQPSPPIFELHPLEMIKVYLVFCAFLFFWFKQYETNAIFIDLRRTKDGRIATETHPMPKGGWFKFVSSPHMTAEVGMYLSLYGLLFRNTSYIYCLFWVLTNQLSNALLTHQWYKETFPKYPKERKALFPYIL